MQKISQFREELFHRGTSHDFTMFYPIEFLSVFVLYAPKYRSIFMDAKHLHEDVIDLLDVHKVELWRTDCCPKYWTALSFTSCRPDLPQRLADVMIASDIPGESWFVDFKADNVKYIVFRNLVLHYTIGNPDEKEVVCQRMREIGIPDSQMHWAE